MPIASVIRSAARRMSVTLNDGKKIPTIGFGAGTAWYGRTGVDPELRDAVLTALKAGYTHLDLAEVYKNEDSIGAALKDMPNKREDIYITEKILPGMADIKGTLKKQLSTLGLEYVDLYLLHAPEKLFPKGSPSQQEAWVQLEALQAEGLTKSIGVSNHRVEDIKKILETCKVKPAVNQIELHPYIYNEAKAIVDICHENGIKIAAYSPSAPITQFKDGPVDPVVEKIAKETDITPGQVLLKWAQQVGDIIVTTSSKESRMKEQLAVPSLPDLSAEQIKAITDAGAKKPSQRKYMVDVFQ